MALQSKELTQSSEKILEALKDNKPKTFTQLKKDTNLSRPTISNSLKSLQKQKMVQRNPDTRKYQIQTQGLEHLKKATAEKTIRQGTVIDYSNPSLPTQSIIAIDIPDITPAQQKILMQGTKNTAEACFNQFLADSQQMRGSITKGRIAYTMTIDINQTYEWLNTKEGKQYIQKQKT